MTEIEQIRLIASLADSITSTIVLLVALIWQSRRVVALHDKLTEVHTEHKRDLRAEAGRPTVADKPSVDS